MAFQKGQSGNPAGRASGKQAFADRAKFLLEKYTAGQIKELAFSPEFDRLPSYDAMIIKRAAEALTDNGRQSMDSLLDRLLGKPDANHSVEYSGSVALECEGLPATLGWLRDITRKDETGQTPQPVLN